MFFPGYMNILNNVSSMLAIIIRQVYVVTWFASGFRQPSSSERPCWFTSVIKYCWGKPGCVGPPHKWG